MNGSFFVYFPFYRLLGILKLNHKFFANKTLHKISYENMGFIDYHVIFGTDEVLLQFAEDKNRNGTIEELKEPVYLKSFSVTEKTASDFIDSLKLAKIQQLIL